MAKAPKSVDISKGQCLYGKICFEIDKPARLRITSGKSGIARYEDKPTGTTRRFCATCGTLLLNACARRI